ncbi:MAG: bifunctional 3-phosphoshikimate 1-carboxyvinyltransferase/cytidylate kinase [Pseudomonadota bacterium]|nr:bifunctional 3-phosphoshikimate 1-carboxyvinyltransferase/cytidylate kinase [Pseudomonadota bacterium]
MFHTAFLDIPALRAVQGSVRLPGSKSISNRVLLLAALCEGRTVVHDLLDSDDTRVMLDALRALGCGVQIDGACAVIDGLGGRPRQPQADLFLGNAGTAMRPLTAALAVLGGDYQLRGIPRMHERPIGDLVDALRALGCQVDYLGNPGFPPLRIGQPRLNLGAPIAVRGDVSSQFLTALLLALPLAAQTAGQDVVIDVAGELISKPYVDITLQLLARFGVSVQRQGWQRFVIPQGSRYRSPGSIHVEADASSASYFIAAATLSASANGLKDSKNQKDPTGLQIEGVGEHSIQGDIRFVEAARHMGARIDSGPNWLRVSRGAWPLKAIDLDCNHIPDAAMTLAVMALYADGPSTLRNIASWRVKETDRIAAMATELRKLGASVQEGADFIRITPPAQPGDWRAARIHTYDDHRMAMCASLAAFNPAGLPVRIEDPQCVAKTFPDYFETLFAVAQPAARVPVICIDGPTASGKGTVAAEVARCLGYHLLDSGALYRLAGLAARRAGLAPEAAHSAELAALARTLPVRFDAGRIWLNGEDVTDAIRTEEAGMDASRISALAPVREALLHMQHTQARLPGLVADGRDMGTVIFPDAPLKVFLTASAATRAERRHKQLISKGISASIDALRADLEARDARDKTRTAAPLKPAQDALPLDNSHLTVEQSVNQVLDWWQARQPFD